jgi:hypothetical protein
MRDRENFIWTPCKAPVGLVTVQGQFRFSLPVPAQSAPCPRMLRTGIPSLTVPPLSPRQQPS